MKVTANRLKQWGFLFGFLCFLIGGGFVWKHFQDFSVSDLPQRQISQVCNRGVCVHVQLAISPQAQEQGLMYVTGMDLLSGMLFIFPNEGVYQFWMKNTLIPLDMIWIDKNKRIIDIVSAPPCVQDPCPTYGPNQQALYVLEVNSGATSLWGWERGQEVMFK